MKRLWVVPVLAIFLAILCSSTVRSVNRFCRDGCDRLEQSVALLDTGDSDGAAQLLWAVEDDFQKWRLLSNAFLRHAEMDPVQEALTEAAASAEIGEWTDFRTACRQAQMRLAHLAENEALTLGNLW